MDPKPDMVAGNEWREVSAGTCRRCPARTLCVLYKLRSRCGWTTLVPARRNYKSKEYVFHEGEDCACIMTLARGRIQIRRRDASGALLLVDWPQPGRLLDYRALLPGASHRASARAQGTVEICAAPRGIVANLLETRGELLMDLLQEAERELQQIDRAIELRSARPLEARVRLALQMFAEAGGEEGEGGAWHVELPIHRRDLAALVGARPETISRILHDIEDKGLAHFTGRHVGIPSLDRLSGAQPPVQAAGVAR